MDVIKHFQYSSRATNRYGNSIAADAIGDVNEKRLERRLLPRWVQLAEHMSLSPVFSGIRVTLSFCFIICFVDRCFVFLYFFVWPLCCVVFLDIRIVIILLVSSCNLTVVLYFLKLIDKIYIHCR